MPTEAEVKPVEERRLYSDINQGRTVCFKHLGSYGTHAVKARPQGEGSFMGAAMWITPLDSWVVVTALDYMVWMREMGEPPKCEDCGYTPFKEGGKDG